MADTGFNDVQSRTKEVKILLAVVKVVGASSASNSAVTIEAGGDGMLSVARTGTGAYKIISRDQYVDFVGGMVQVMAGTAIDLVAQPIQQTLDTTTKDFTWRANTGASPADTAVGVTHRFLIALFLKNTGAT